MNEVNELLNSAQQGRDSMPDELCNFIVSEFELKASVIFSYSDNNTLIALGRSSNSKNNYFKGSRFNCTVCEVNSTDSKVNIYSNSSCDLQISDSLVYEICVGFNVAVDQPILIKLAKDNTFTEEDRHSINIIAEFVKFNLETWLFSRGGKSHISEIPFSQLVNDIAEELRSPANSIVGTSSMLNESILTSSQAEYAQTIKQNSHDLLFTINDLVDLARFELGKMPQQSTQIYVKKLIDETIDLFKTNLKTKQIEFTTSMDEQVPESFLSDDKKLRYILNNILTFITGRVNEGKVHINVNRLTANLIQFRIEDDFEKLTDTQIVSLFHPFSISKIEKLKRTNLTGISLTLVQKFVTFLGGDIKVSADNKEGTVFTFTINGEVMSDIESNLSKLPKSTSDNNKVLVIEDDYATSKLLNNYLSKWGYDPIIVSTEEEAFKYVEKEKLLAVILDIELPNTNGLELLRKIHEHKNTKNVPVIVCSIEPDQQKAFLLGAVEYFIKPINYNYLVEVLTSYKLRKDSNILCVDDDVPTLNLIKQAIEAAGYHALAESDSTKVMDMIKSKEVDLAIIDLDMPEIDGIKLIELIKSEDKFTNLPIIIYTGKDGFKDDLNRIDGLFEELLDKRSVNIEDLGNTIDSMINRYETPPPVEEVMEKSDVTKILLAEDYKHSQIIVTRLLKKNGFENVVVVENGEEALNMAEKEKFALVLMDMQMPIMNGFEATERIRQIPGYKDIPIIALTAFAMKGDREKCIEAGATDYIPKPIDSKEFIEKVKHYTNVE